MKRIVCMILCLVLALGLVACDSTPAQSDDQDNASEAPAADQPSDADAKDAADDQTEDQPGEAANNSNGDGLKFAVSLGWMENPSGQRQKLSFEEAFARYGVTDYSIVDANYDGKKQSEQIKAFIAQKPDALFITPSDPIGIASAVAEAANAGIRVYCSDGFVPGATVVSTVFFDNYSCGKYTMQALCDALIEKYPGEDEIEIAMIDLPSNETWDARGHGAKYILSLPQYSRIKVTKTWSWDSTGAVTPRNAIDSFLASDPDQKLKAIWCAWDGAVFEGLEATGTARPDIMYVGCDGGEQCFEKMLAYPDQFIMTAGESVYTMPEMLVNYAFDTIEGDRVPRLVMVPGFGISSEMIVEANTIKDYQVDGINVWELVINYDLPGYVDKINQALEQNGKTTRWIPEI